MGNPEVGRDAYGFARRSWCTSGGCSRKMSVFQVCSSGQRLSPVFPGTQCMGTAAPCPLAESHLYLLPPALPDGAGAKDPRGVLSGADDRRPGPP